MRKRKKKLRMTKRMTKRRRKRRIEEVIEFSEVTLILQNRVTLYFAAPCQAAASSLHPSSFESPHETIQQVQG
jgi:hypothetical protein